MEALVRCQYCGTKYHWKKSGSWSLKMTFCSVEHERAFNGTAIEDIFAVERMSYQITELVGKAG